MSEGKTIVYLGEGGRDGEMVGPISRHGTYRLITLSTGWPISGGGEKKEREEEEPSEE